MRLFNIIQFSNQKPQLSTRQLIQHATFAPHPIMRKNNTNGGIPNFESNTLTNILSFLHEPSARNDSTDIDSTVLPSRSSTTKEEIKVIKSAKSILHKSPLNKIPWKPATTHLLLHPASPSLDVIDHVFGKSFHRALQKELIDTDVLKKLTPAKTAFDLDPLVSSLDSFLSVQNGEKSNTSNNGIISSHSSIRGDISTFIPRTYRSQENFPLKHTNLHHLISSVEQVVVKNLCCYHNVPDTTICGDANRGRRRRMEVDLSKTSVQVASYPGDGISGYPRHCDRGAQCNDSNTNAAINISTIKSKTGKNTMQMKSQRLITAIYYLTEEDWNELEDGGCLRVYNSVRDKKHFDIPPIADRLVIFRSDIIEHEVMPSNKRRRLAVTIWLYGSIVEESILEAERSLPIINPLHSNRPLPLQNSIELQRKKRIFVSIPSYRDSETHPTIHSLVQTATYPERIYVGAVFQYKTTSPSECNNLFTYPQSLLPQPWAATHLRTLTMDCKDATGPCLARNLAQSLHLDEEFILQIDSHMRFRENWDVYLINQLEACPRPNRSVLTAYPHGYTLPHCLPDEERATLLVPWKFDDNGILRQKGRILSNDIMVRKKCGDKSNSDKDDRLDATSNIFPQPKHQNKVSKNIPCLLYAAGFNFSHSSVLDDCPYDSHLPFLFFGEELSMAVRLFTHGYDLFAPPTAVCYHLWSRDHRVTFQIDTGFIRDSSIDTGNNISDSRKVSVNEGNPTDKNNPHESINVKHLRSESEKVVLNQLLGTGRGLGSDRRVEDFSSKLGVDFKNKIISHGAENGGLSVASFVNRWKSCPSTAMQKDKDTLKNVTQNILEHYSICQVEI